jgi:hypothetical protein
MNLAILLCAACLEVGGDALVRWGIKSGQVIGFILGAALLFGYGLTVNFPKWEFSQLLGLYIVLFFLVSQAMGFFLFHEPVTQGRLVGGFLITAGGACILFWK